MVRCWRVNLTFVLALAALVLSTGLGSAAISDKPKPKPPPKAPRKPQLPPGTIAGRAYRVQARHPGWKTFAVTNPTGAVRSAAVLKAQGWQVRLKKTASPNLVRVQGRLLHWRTRGMTRNRIIAHRMAAVLRLQHFHARIR